MKTVLEMTPEEIALLPKDELVNVVTSFRDLMEMLKANTIQQDQVIAELHQDNNEFCELTFSQLSKSKIFSQNLSFTISL